MRRARRALSGACLALAVLSASAVAVLTRPPAAEAAADWSLTSPDGGVVAELYRSPAGELSYEVRSGGTTVLERSSLGLTLAGDDGDLTRGLTFVNRSDTTVDQTYPLRHGKAATGRDHANEATLTFANAAGVSVQVVVRAYDDGIAIRYRLPGSGTRQITAEATSFNLPAAATAWMQPPAPNRNYEAEFSEGRIGTDFRSGEYAWQALADVPGDPWVLLAEAAVYGTYGASHLQGSGADDDV